MTNARGRRLRTSPSQDALAQTSKHLDAGYTETNRGGNVRTFSPRIPLNAHGLPDLDAVPTSVRRVHAQVAFANPARLSPHDREHIVSAVRHVLSCATDAWDATVKLDRLLRRSGGRSRLAVEVTFSDIDVSAAAAASPT